MKFSSLICLSNTKFKRLTGVNFKTFYTMLELLKVAYDSKHQNRGRYSKLSLEEMLLLALSYLRSYATFFETGLHFDVSESTAQRIVFWVENVLVSSGIFALSGRKRLVDNHSKLKTVAVDVTEQQIERPKYHQHEYYSGKKKFHTLKTQVIINSENLEILAIAQSKGTTHDFKLYKQSIGKSVLNSIKIQADSGYQGIKVFHIFFA